MVFLMANSRLMSAMDDGVVRNRLRSMCSPPTRGVSSRRSVMSAVGSAVSTIRPLGSTKTMDSSVW